ADESNEWNPCRELTLDEPDALQHVRQIGRRVEWTDAREILLTSQRLRDHWPHVLRQLQIDADADERMHEIREQDRRVHRKALDWLQRHFGAEIGMPTDLEQCHALANSAVFG